MAQRARGGWRRAAFGLLAVLGLLALARPGLADDAHVTGAETGAATVAKDAAVVEAFHATLLDVMRSGAPFADREAVMTAAVAAAFDVETIARISVGRHWQGIAPGQAARILELLGWLVAATYADRFDSYAGQAFATLERRDLRGDQSMVRTRLTKSDGGVVRLDYVLRDAGAGPRIFNVVADGVADLSVRRADYASIIKRGGIDGLIRELEHNVGELRSGHAG